MSCLECLRYGLSNGVNDSVIEVNLSKPTHHPFCFKIFPLLRALSSGPRRSRSATLRGRQAASRWAGLPPVGRQLKVAVRIFVKKNSSFAKVAAGRSSLAKTGELKLRKEKNIARKRKLFKMKRKEGRKEGRQA